MRLEHLSSISSLTPEGSLGGSTTGEFDTENGRSSLVSESVVVEGSSTIDAEAFFLNLSKCLLTLLPSVRSTVNEEGPVLERMMPGSHGSPGLKFLTKTSIPFY